MKKVRRSTRKRPRKGGAPSVKALIKRADAVFSLYIRGRDGWKCIVCGRDKNVAAIQNGHYVKRGKHSVRFDEVNCNAQCSSCNFLHNSYHDYYERAIRAKWGDETVNEMLARAAVPEKLTRDTLLKIISKYEA